MAVAEADVAHAIELFSDLGDITTRKMMGGLCLYHQGKIFAILMADGSLWLKGAGAMVDSLTAEGCTRWTYQRAGRAPTVMPYWSMPESGLDDPEIACDWARRALSHL
ncbi:TfoX-like protein [Roseibacterium elongatum DSM 19469]|uniref:TfoX-like protein n=1 Tax=Roseicyclus elongatus DSM 19469 TaxID=1294273 RepID=W8RUN5_9RHOB|nr:TfoX/Sxy family protein [Roseibacterium elongatum]AHM04933.1 TfoX-like protein [Roseibacterium elongatum DSM 19469]